MNSINRRVLNKKFELTFELLAIDFNKVDSDFKHKTDDIENLGFKFMVEIKPRVISNDVEYVAIRFGYVKNTMDSSVSGQFQRKQIRKFFRFSAAIVDRNGTIVNKMCSPFLSTTSYRLMQGWDRFIERKQVLNPESGLLDKNNLKICCNLEVRDDIQTIFSDSESMANTFEKCYKSLLKDHELSDFTIVVKDKEFAVHRSVLAARSPVFRAMITTDMKEKRESRVVLHDIDEDVAEQLIHFIYTGTASRVKEVAHKLSTVADFFDMHDLKMFCAQNLFSVLSEDNVLEALRFGETHGIRELVLNAIDYIGDNRERVRSKVIQRT